MYLACSDVLLKLIRYSFPSRSKFPRTKTLGVEGVDENPSLDMEFGKTTSTIEQICEVSS